MVMNVKQCEGQNRAKFAIWPSGSSSLHMRVSECTLQVENKLSQNSCMPLSMLLFMIRIASSSWGSPVPPFFAHGPVGPFPVGETASTRHTPSTLPGSGGPAVPKKDVGMHSKPTPQRGHVPSPL